VVSPGPAGRGKLCGQFAGEQRDDPGEQCVEFLTDGGDLGIAVAREKQAGLLGGEYGGGVGASVEQHSDGACSIPVGSWRNIWCGDR
jgi:hypothetical protein